MFKETSSQISASLSVFMFPERSSWPLLIPGWKSIAVSDACMSYIHMQIIHVVVLMHTHPR